MMIHRTFIKLSPAHVLDPSKPYSYGIVKTIYGDALLVFQSEYLLALGFTKSVDDLARPGMVLVQDNRGAEAFWALISMRKPVPAVLLGTDFQQQVWHALLDLKEGQVVTYQHMANTIGRPKSVRAVANAIGANPISFLIPCHQVVRTDGGLGGYRWGLNVKKAILGRGD